MKPVVDLDALRQTAEADSDLAKLIQCVDAYQSLIKSIEPHLHRNASVYAGFKIQPYADEFFE